MKLWPQSKAAQKILIIVGGLLIFDAAAISYFVYKINSQWNMVSYNTDEFEKQYADKENLVLISSLFSSSDSEIQAKLTEAKLDYLSASKEEERNQWTAASRYYDSAYRQARAAEGANSELALWILYVRGRSKYQERDFDGAVERFKQLLKDAADNERNRKLIFHAHLWLGRSLQSQGNYASAIEQLKIALQLASKLDANSDDKLYTFHAKQNLGLCYTDSGQFDEATEMLESVRQLLQDRRAPMESQNLNCAWLSRAKVGAGRATEALSDLNVSLQIAKDHQELLKQRAWAYYKLKNFDASVADYSHLIKLFPTEDDYLIKRAESYEAQGKFKDALADVEMAVKHNSNNYNWKMDRIRILVEASRDNEVLKAYDELIQQYPKYADLRIKRAQFNSYKARYAESLKDYTWCLDDMKAVIADRSSYAANRQQLALAAAIYKERAAVYDKLGQKQAGAEDRKKAEALVAILNGN